MRSKLILVAAVAMGLLTTVLFFRYLQGLDGGAAVADGELVEVVTAGQPIPENQLLGAGSLKLVSMPAAAVHPDALRTTAEAEGKYAAAQLSAGEVLLAHHVRSRAEEALLVSRKVREGFRAVSVGVNFVQSVSNLIEPGDQVDVIYTPADKGTGPVVSAQLLGEVQVLAIGRRMTEAAADTPYVEYSSVTLEVGAQDVVKLVNADEQGTISLVLRSRLQPAAAQTQP